MNDFVKSCLPAEMCPEYAEKVIKRASEVLSEKKCQNLFLYDNKALEEVLKIWKQELPEVTPHFAVKCNHHDLIVKKLVQLDGSFDCASLVEAQKVVKNGGKVSHIIYSNPTKTEAELSECARMGVGITVADSLLEVEKIARCAPNMKVLLRIRINDETATLSFGNRFGVLDFEYEPMVKAIVEANLDFQGCSFHVGSDSHNPEVFAHAIRVAKKIMGFGETLGAKPAIIDLGGGWNCNSKFPAFAAHIREEIKKSPGIRFLAEPGRYFATKFMHLAMPLYGRRTTQGAQELTIPNGISGCFQYYFMFDQHPTLVPIQVKKQTTDYQRTILNGCTCNPKDIILSDAQWPLMHPEDGDFVLQPWAGAYSLAMANIFNGFTFMPGDCFLPLDPNDE